MDKMNYEPEILALVFWLFYNAKSAVQIVDKKDGQYIVEKMNGESYDISEYYA